MGYCNLRCETEIVAQRRNLEIVRNGWTSTGETILRTVCEIYVLEIGATQGVTVHSLAVLSHLLTIQQS